MMGISFELCLSDSGIVKSVLGGFSQQLSTHFKSGNVYFDDGYAHILPLYWNYGLVTVISSG